MMIAATSPSVGGVAADVPAKAADNSANSHGRPKAASADDHSVAAGRVHHGQRVIGLEDVAVAQHRNRR